MLNNSERQSIKMLAELVAQIAIDVRVVKSQVMSKMPDRDYVEEVNEQLESIRNLLEDAPKECENCHSPISRCSCWDSELE